MWSSFGPSCKPKLLSTITKSKRHLHHGVQENNAATREKHKFCAIN
uniref:Uncharacterized protein n=1 Tax=Setaria italica TaxID=4555 RepID=K3Y3W4_SETIT